MAGVKVPDFLDVDWDMPDAAIPQPTFSQPLQQPPAKQSSGNGRSNRRQDYVPPFLTKAYDIVSDPNTDDIVSWMPDGKSFTVWKPAECGRDLLPLYFKHNNFSSFVRQLNTYGFRKTDPDHWQFQHENFKRGEPELLKDMKRKPVGSSSEKNDELRRDVVEVGAFGSGGSGEVEQLRRDKNILFMELVRLRKEQEQMQNTIHKLVNEMSDQKRQHASTKGTVDRMMNFFANMFNSKGQPLDGQTSAHKRASQKRVADSSADTNKRRRKERLQELNEDAEQWTAEERAAPTIVGRHSSESKPGKKPSVSIEEVQDDDEFIPSDQVVSNNVNHDPFGALMQSAGVPASPNTDVLKVLNSYRGGGGPPTGPSRQWSFNSSGLELGDLQSAMDDYAHNNEGTSNADDAHELSAIIDTMINQNEGFGEVE